MLTSLERRFQEHEPADFRDAAPLHAIRETVTERAATERRVAEAVTTTREAGVSWSAIGSVLGTSGEAARKRYRSQCGSSPVGWCTRVASFLSVAP